MGLKTFINNIRYLARYNIKEMKNEIEGKVKVEDLLNFMNILPKLKENVKENIGILSVEDTIGMILNSHKSVIRYGDGEFDIMQERSISFQEYNPKLKEYLYRILQDTDNKLLVGVPSFYYKIELDKYYDLVYMFIIKYINDNKEFLKRIVKYRDRYISSEFTILYNQYKKYNFSNYFKKIRQIWENKEIVIVCGETVFNHIKYNIFDNSRSIEYVYAPSKNAFDKYDEILKRSLEYSKDKLFIVILGPTANVLVYDLTSQGYRALDLGHIAKDYDAFMKKIDRNSENIIAFFKPD